ncbi:MAG TPA: cupin domain-containing protein [Terracidiphilus sp.]|nr:cupin domain-containing protein [Terracidiphilus sp.]
MNRREFSALLPLLAAAGALTPAAMGAQHAPPGLNKLDSGRYPEGPAPHPSATGRISRHIVIGMLPDEIRLEAHHTTLEPGAGWEPVGTHKHTEMWLVTDGEVNLMTDGDTETLKKGDMGICIAGNKHSVANASKTAPSSYFVVTVGPPE